MAIIIFMAGCNFLNTPLSALGPHTPTPSSVATMLVSPTGVSVSQTATIVAAIEAETLTPTPTYMIMTTATLSRTPFLSAREGELECRVISQSLRNGTHFGPRERFDMGWKVRNIGTVTWEPGTVQFAYFSGTKMYQAALLELPAIVSPGDTIALSADLMTPKQSGTYTTVWSLRRGQNDFCHVSIRIIVP